MDGLGSSRQKILTSLFEPYRASQMQSPNNRFQGASPLLGTVPEPGRYASVSIS
jgi:hypothetical protein